MKVIAFTGAGISKSAGIPTFEEVPGLKGKLSLEYKNAHPEEYQKVCNEMIKNMVDILCHVAVTITYCLNVHI